VGNAVWSGVGLSVLLKEAGLTSRAAHVAFEGMDTPLGKANIKFVRSIPIAKAMASTLLAYEMNGEPLPLKHGYPLRALALGWTGANCVKWLKQITVLESPYEGFFMDKVYRVFPKGQDPATGDIVTGIKLKSIVTRPLPGEQLPAGRLMVLGAAYAGEDRVETVEVSTDNGATWQPAAFIGPDEPFAWRHWQFEWQVTQTGSHTLLSRATDRRGRRQPENAEGNQLGYGNNGIREHGVTFTVV
jgi:DMSO/TMAO reductase YedYZ molybdopterin-dependent catalytic subunit